MTELILAEPDDPAVPLRYLPAEDRVWQRRAAVFCLGLGLTGTAGFAAWQAYAPETVVQAQVVADGQSALAGRTALAEAALRFGAAGPALLIHGGEALVLTARDADRDVAQRQAQSMVDAVLNVPPPAAPAAEAPAPPPAGPLAALQARRLQILTGLDTLDARSSGLSQSLSAVARDIAAASRAASDRKPGRETLEKGQAALADLQLQRLQLLTKFQDDFPAVTVLDGQIAKLRAFLADEQRRVDRPLPRSAEPADAMLTAERDRLHAEQAQIEDRRHALTVDLASVERSLAALPAMAPASPAAVAVAAAAPAVLVQAATTAAPAIDVRMPLLAEIAAAGLMLSALGMTLVRRRPVATALRPASAPALESGLRLRGLAAAPHGALAEEDRMVMLHFASEAAFAGEPPR